GAVLLHLPQKKDRSDLACALQAIGMVAPKEVLLIGFTGGRPDHHLASLLEISRFTAERHVKTAAIGPEGEYHFLTSRSPKFRLERPKGTLVSVLALGKTAEGITMTGFEYNLKNATLDPSSHGLSN